MKRKWFYIGASAVFIVLAAGVALVAQSRLPKTSKASISVQNCQFTTEPELTFDLNQTVQLEVTSDTAGQFSIENYNVSQALEADKPVRTTFTAARSGVFDTKISGCDDHVMMSVRDANGQLPETSDHTNTDADHATPETPEATEAPAQNPSGGHDDAVPHD